MDKERDGAISVPADATREESVERAAPGQRFGLVAARSKPEARSLAEDIRRWLEAAGHAVVAEEALGPDAATQVDAIVVLGGDGLMMRAANAYPDTPLLGINFGNVGFLALAERRDWEAALSALVEGRYAIEEGATLDAVVERAGKVAMAGWAINDVVLRGGLRMVDLEVYIDGHFVNTYPGDGMIVSTPHGSTAYCMAAGGPILSAGVRGFAIVPISCHSPIRMPLVVSEEATIEIVPANDREAAFVLDGREIGPLQQGDVVCIQRGRHRFRLITIGSTNFYEAFRTKFNYRIRPDAVPSRRLRSLPTDA